jgi:hypothetical protein
MMRWHTVDYTERDGNRARFDRGFWLDLPRLMPLCRLLGHRPVVDGYGPINPGLHAARWVVCDRCGVRPEPQGRLDPDLWSVGQRYAGPVRTEWPTDRGDLPGPWPAAPTGTLGGQLVLGHRGDYAASLEVKIGNGGSEHVLAAQATLYPLGGLYLHTERHGTWLQRRLNPTGYESRLIGISVHSGQAYWRLWAKRNDRSRSDPRWQQGSFPVDLRTILFGPARYSYEDVGERVPGLLRLPHGDDHPVTLQLQRVAFGRTRLRRRKLSWSVDCDSPTGIPTRPGGRGITGVGVEVSDQAVRSGRWEAAALAALAVRITTERSDWAPTPTPEVVA